MIQLLSLGDAPLSGALVKYELMCYILQHTLEPNYNVTK